MQNYFTSQRDQIFRNVEVLIYVFDVESRDIETDLHYYQTCLEALLQNSPEAKVFCLIHKLDLVQEDQRDIVSNSHFKAIANHTHRSNEIYFDLFQIFKEREADLLKISQPADCTCFRTSIWDETLYKVCLSSCCFSTLSNKLRNT